MLILLQINHKVDIKENNEESMVGDGVRPPVEEDSSGDDDDYYSKYFGCNFRLNMGRTPNPEDCASDDEVSKKRHGILYIDLDKALFFSTKKYLYYSYISTKIYFVVLLRSALPRRF